VSVKKVAVILIPIAVAAIALGIVFALPLQMPDQDLAGTEDTEQDNGQITPAAASATEDCTTVTNRVNNYVVFADGQGTDETRIAAAKTLVDEYCQRPELVQEIGAMMNPGMGLVAYGCDAASGMTGDSTLQASLEEHAEIYCDSVLILILEESEPMLVTIDNYQDELLQQAENTDDPDIGTVNATSTEFEQAQLKEAAELVKMAKTLAYDGKLYEAAKSFDAGAKIVESLSEV
jgi:hypothetical protein